MLLLVMVTTVTGRASWGRVAGCAGVPASACRHISVALVEMARAGVTVWTVSYGHGDKIARAAAGTPAAGDTAPIGPALYWRADVRRVLAARDIAALYRVLKDDAGITQREIARRTGQSQSEVSEILKGRRVLAYDVLVRIAAGLGIPRELMGLSYGEIGAYGGEVRVAEPPEEVDEGMLRRDLLAAGSVALIGVPVLGKLLNRSTGPGEMGLPSKVGMSDVAEIMNTTEQLRSAARARGGQARAVSAAAIEYGRLTQIPAAEPVAARLGSALAELNTLAGWCCYDSGLHRRARWHYRQAMDYAAGVGDDFRVIGAVQHAAIIDREHDMPDDALKLYQLAQFKLIRTPGDDPRVPTLRAWLDVQSASALALLDQPERARSELSQALDGRGQLSDAFDRADMDHLHALVHLHLGHLDVAESFATSSVRGWGEGERRDGVLGDITLAVIHVRAGEPRGLQLAHHALTGVTKINSVRARQQLEPLAAALEARPSSSDTRQLARMARQLATTHV
jgi:transcriptional regulator with XRE-family HTH domain